MSRPLLHPALPGLALALLLGAALPAAAEPVPAPSAPATPAAQTAPPQDARGETSAPSLGADSLKPEKPARKPYLSDDKAPDSLAILPPPPASHSPAEAADRAAYAVTRAYEGTPRWALATNDVAEGGSALLEDFACVLGQRLDLGRVPNLLTLLDRARLDIARSTRAPKLHYRRLRPFIGNEAPICVARDQKLADSFSYPSGHSAQGWAYAMIMATLLPEKATRFMVRGRLYGESRVVCGVHWISDVEAARLNAAAVFAVLLADPAFRADMEKARTELTRVLEAGGQKPEAAICEREDAAARQPLL